MAIAHAAASDGSLCPLCQGGSRLKVERGDGYRIVQCVGCALVRSDPMPVAKDLKEYYDGFLYGLPSPEQMAQARKRRYRDVDLILRDLGKLVDLRGVRSVLDFGGGIGLLGGALSDHFPDVTMFEVDPQAAAVAREMFPKLNVVEGDFVTGPDLLAPADLVFAMHVIEHVIDLPGFVAQMRRLCRPGGTLVLGTPNRRSLEHLVRPDILYVYLRSTRPRGAAVMARNLWRMATDSWLSCDPPRHTLAFDRLNLARALEQGGFRVQEARGFYSSQDYFAAPTYRNLSFRSGGQAARSLVGLFSRAAMALAGAVDRRGDRGGNLVVVAQVPG